MANGLTGEFDAVVEVSVETVNRILATLHQNGASEDASPNFPHSFATRVGETFSIVKHAAWALAIVKGPALAPAPGSQEPAPVPSNAMPSGAAKAAADAQKKLVEVLTRQPGPTTVRGTARVQVSTPTVTFPPGSTSEVTVHVQIRAHYVPDPSTLALPNPIHGEVVATFLIDVRGFFGKTMLEVKPSADDKQIFFVPAPGSGSGAEAPAAVAAPAAVQVVQVAVASPAAAPAATIAADAETISKQIRLALRSEFEPTNVELDKKFKFLGFKSLGSGPFQTIAVPFELSQPSPASSALASVTNVFLKPGDHFAVAISRQYVESLLDGMKQGLLAFHQTIVTPWYMPNYEVGINSVDLQWQVGSIKLTVTGSATAPWPWPDFDFTVEQLLTVTLGPGPKILVQAAGDPSISGLPDVAIGQAVQAIKAQRNAALDQANAATKDALKGVTLNDALKSFDESASATYASVEIQPEGVVLRGAVSVKARAPVVVDFIETADGNGFTAFKSWVPGGTIQRYVWSWERENPYFDVPHHHLEGTKLTNVVEDDHGFIMAMPEEAAPSPDGRLCLTVQGTQVPSGGGPPVLTWGESCQIVWPIMCVAVPGGWDSVMAAPVWHTEAPRDAAMDEAIVGHVDAYAHSRSAREPGRNTIVHFADAQSAKPLETLGRALAQRSRRDTPIAVVLVLPRGSFQVTRSSFAGRLGSLGREFRGSIVLTEDYDAGWTRTFGVERTPATYLINGRGEVVWQGSGQVNAASLTAALDEHATAGALFSARPLRLAVRPGDRAPDALLDDGRGERLALRKFRGQRVQITFWKSWSAPCLRELDRLQRAHEAARQEGTLVVAVNDGEDPRRVAEIAREHRLSYPVVPDPDRGIARRYGVNGWPTTISIGEDGLVERVHFGVTPDREAPRPRAMASAV